MNGKEELNQYGKEIGEFMSEILLTLFIYTYIVVAGVIFILMPIEFEWIMKNIARYGFKKGHLLLCILFPVSILCAILTVYFFRICKLLLKPVCKFLDEPVRRKN